jgi:predicted adenine nucleotide alpha hydrolase (AANH) superfamily ATPase
MKSSSTARKVRKKCGQKISCKKCFSWTEEKSAAVYCHHAVDCQGNKLALSRKRQMTTISSYFLLSFSAFAKLLCTFFLVRIFC